MNDLKEVIDWYMTLTEEEKATYLEGPFLIIDLPSGKGTGATDETVALDPTKMLTTQEIRRAAAGKKIVFLADNAHWIVGREIQSTILLIVGSVSRRHASLTRLPDGQFIIVDFGSTNGTEVNGKALKPMVAQPLTDRAWVVFGTVETKFFHGPTFRTVLESMVQRLQGG